jgi:hypothetical protein
MRQLLWYRSGVTHPEIIAALGGYRTLAAALRRDPSVIWRWQRNGIPPKRWREVEEAARRCGIAGIDKAALAAGYDAEPVEAA